MNTVPVDIATVQALRSDVALQIARHARRMGVSQLVAARQLGLPQPTLSKIINGRVSDLSLELLIRTAARAGLAMTLHTGRVPQEAGAFVSGSHSPPSRASPIQAWRRSSGFPESFREPPHTHRATTGLSRAQPTSRAHCIRRVVPLKRSERARHSRSREDPAGGSICAAVPRCRRDPAAGESGLCRHWRFCTLGARRDPRHHGRRCRPFHITAEIDGTAGGIRKRRLCR